MTKAPSESIKIDENAFKKKKKSQLKMKKEVSMQEPIEKKSSLLFSKRKSFEKTKFVINDKEFSKQSINEFVPPVLKQKPEPQSI